MVLLVDLSASFAAMELDVLKLLGEDGLPRFMRILREMYNFSAVFGEAPGQYCASSYKFAIESCSTWYPGA